MVRGKEFPKLPEAPKNAELVLRSRLKDIDNQEFVDKTSDTVNQLFDQFIKSYATRKCSLRTRVGYEGKINRYIVPCIGNIPYQSLTATQIERLHGDMAS